MQQFECPNWPRCGCPDGTVAPDCPGNKSVSQSAASVQREAEAPAGVTPTPAGEPFILGTFEQPKYAAQPVVLKQQRGFNIELFDAVNLFAESDRLVHRQAVAQQAKEWAERFCQQMNSAAALRSEAGKP